MTENTTIRSSATVDIPNEAKRRRRFSSPFRLSRSRPRSASEAFPSTAALVSTISLTTTPTDVPDIPKAFQARPDSYHAPDIGMHPAYRSSADQLTLTSLSNEGHRASVQASPTRIGFITEREVQDDSVPPVPPLPAGIDNERRGRRSRSWGNAGLMLQSAIRHATPPAKGSRSLGNSPIITHFDIPNRSVNAPRSVVQPDIARNDDGHDKTNSARAGHSRPVTRGLWMGDISPVLSKRTPMTTDELVGKEDHHQVLPVHTDGTPTPRDIVHLSEQPPKSGDYQSFGPSKDFADELITDKTQSRTQKSLEKPPNRPTEEAMPWPGTLLGTTKSNSDNDDRIEDPDEAPVPQAFIMQSSGDISPLICSSRASLHEVSDNGSEFLNNAIEQDARRPKCETENIGAGDVSDNEGNAPKVKDRLQPEPLQTVFMDKQDEEHKYKGQARTVDSDNVVDAHYAQPIMETTSSETNSPPTDCANKQGELISYETKPVSVGDVSPSSDVEYTRRAETTPVQVLDMQSALETRVIGAGDVSPVATRSSAFIATSSKGDENETYDDERVEKRARPSIERFYTADVDFDLEPTKIGNWIRDQDENGSERPRYERFETAQEDVQGSSELTIPKIRQPTTRYATVMASEPIATYKEYTGSLPSSSDDLLKVMEPEASSGALTPQRAERADAASRPIATRRVSASQLQVVHAVEEYAASNSSLASWDQDSNAADAISEPGAAVEMKDESDLVTPVAHVPRNAQYGEQADQAGVSNHNLSNSEHNEYFNGQSASDSTHQKQQQPPSTSDMTVPERSKSLLSIISSAVSSTPISPASSNAGRSTPSTIHRMQRDFANARGSSLTEVQIPEEPANAKDDQTPTARHEDYDLYADHNGVVKDVRDEHGHPLRVDPTPNIAPAQLAGTTTGASSIATLPDTPDSRARRYSFERPMSFISGPQDDDGRPQDQINQPLAGAMATPPIPPQSKRRSQQYRPTPSGAIYSNMAPMQDDHWPPGEGTSKPPVQLSQQPVQEPAPMKVVRQPTRFVPRSHENDQDEDSPVQQAANLPPKRTPPAIPTDRPIPNGQLPLLSHQLDQREQNSRMGGNPQVSAPRSVSAPLQQMSMTGQDPRVASQPLGSPPVGPATGPRNEFEYQQQIMQLQAKYSRFRGTESQANMQQPSPTQQDTRHKEKPSSKPRLAAAIKGIVGRTSPNAPQSLNVPPAPSGLTPRAPPTDTSRAESFVSAVSNTSRARATSTPGGQPNVVAAPQRFPSLGAESHYSHVSHGSTQVQQSLSRQDLTMPGISAPYQQPQLQQPHRQQLLAPSQGAQSQNYRASTGTIPDSGKKKRFSTITGLFGKGNAAADLQGKFKLAREEKKAQKAQRHTSQPIPQSPPAQQWPPPHTQFIAHQQPGVLHVSSQGFPVTGHAAQPVDPRFMPPNRSSHQLSQDSQGRPQPQDLTHQFAQPRAQPQVQPAHLPQQQGLLPRSDEGSAYLGTKRLAEQRQAKEATGQTPRPVYENPNTVGSVPRHSVEQQPQQLPRHSLQRPPPNGYYYPEKPQSPLEQGAYRTSSDEHQRAHQVKQQQLEAEQRLNQGLPRSPGEQGAYGTSAASRLQMQQQQQRRESPMETGVNGTSQAVRQRIPQHQHKPDMEQGAYGTTLKERQRIQQQPQHPLPSPEAFGRSQIHYDQIQHGPPQPTNIPLQHERQQIPSNQQQPAMARDDQIRQAEQELAQHRWQQQQMQLRQFHLQQQAQLAQQAANPRSVSGPLLSHASPFASPIAQRHVSSPTAEPEYDTPPIPGAYDHVQGVFVSLEKQQHAFTTAHSHAGGEETDPQMQPISPQVSAQSQMSPNARHHSDASTVSVVSPISGPTPEPPTADQRLHKPRMASISEVHQQQQQQQGRPWHMNFPAGTTEQDIVRARQKQFFQQQFASQQQAQAERHASSPSPRVSPDKQSPPFSAPPHQTQEQGGGFREVLPRISPQPFPAPRSAPLERPSHSPQPTQQIPLRPQQSSGWPLRSSPDLASPLQSTTGSPLPPTEPQNPRHAGDFGQSSPYAQQPQQTAFEQRSYESRPPDEVQRSSVPDQQLEYGENMPDEAPPSYVGPGVPNDSMEKSNPDRPRPPNIVTAPSNRGRQPNGRPRQASLVLMQHPQPASMAAPPQRTAPDMGSESLRRQMLQQEEHARMERIQREQMQAAIREREQREREAARARAQELERSVSGGGRVGSLRSVRGSHSGGAPGWERRGLQGGNSRPIFELPALNDDDEPVMRATSFPGQEWVPPMYVDD
ncbi:hypothetical protein EJ07DRAFT_170528 [Lizonia empirigonia]|nr:hypothetical protein EJ07DRAFT_170528 [Lizonia empirigonia]